MKCKMIRAGVLLICLALTGTVQVYGVNSKTEQGRVTIQLTEGVILDAVIETSDVIPDSVKLYRAAADRFDGKKLINALLGDTPEDISAEEWENEAPAYYYRGDLGSNWKNVQGTVYAGESAYIETEHWSSISRCFPVVHEGNEIEVVFDSETKDDDFSFAVRKDASDIVGEYIKIITGFEGIQMSDAYSFSYQQMEKMKEYVDNASENEQAKPEESSMMEWGERDNCYWMFFEQLIDGIPVLSNFVSRQDELYVPASITEAGYTQNGIEYIKFGRSFEIVSENTVKLIPVEEIYENLRRKYELSIVEGIIIDQMKLIYYPLPVGNDSEGRWECDMIPAWQFRVRQGDYTDYVYINAVDGDEIIG